ncbi:MAG: hypothetical protein ACRDNY_05840 [Gaiellaceae bacterium]
MGTRMVGESTVQGRFVDVADARTLANLRAALAASAIHFGLDDIDAATIRLKAPRAFTQTVSRFVYEQRDEQGSFAGIHYGSRLGDPFVNWAIFEPAPDAPSPFLSTSSAPVEADDPDLHAALDVLGLVLVGSLRGV